MSNGFDFNNDGKMSATERDFEYQVYKDVTKAGNNSTNNKNASSGSDSSGCAVILVLAIIVGVVSAASPVLEGFLFWGILLFLFLRFAFSHNFKESFMNSVEFANLAGVKSEEILKTEEDIDDFFLN